MSNQVKLSGSIALTKLTHAKIKTKKGAECLIIPIDANVLDIDKNGAVYIPVNVIYKPDGDSFGQNGFLAKTIGTDQYKAATDEKKEEWKGDQSKFTPIMGSIKDWSTPVQDNNTGQVENVETEEIDDLPF